MESSQFLTVSATLNRGSLSIFFKPSDKSSKSFQELQEYAIDKDLVLDNVRSSLRKNLNHFSNMSEDEILTHRKNKFLNIGRSKGFVTNKGISDNLVMQNSLIQNIKTKIYRNKKITFSLIFSLALLLTIIIFL